MISYAKLLSRGNNFFSKGVKVYFSFCPREISAMCLQSAMDMLKRH